MSSRVRLLAAARAVAALALCLALVPTEGARAQPAANPNPTQLEASHLETTRQLLDWLGVDGVIEQTNAIAELALQSEARFRRATPAEQAQWRRALLPRLNPTTLRERIVRATAAQVPAATLQQALTRLQMPLPRRARYFELALAQPGSATGLKDFRARFDAEPNPARRQLAKQLVETSAAAALVACWQSAISAEVEKLAGGAPTKPADAVRERTLHLTPLAEAHALYTYRYFSDAELGTYRDILADDAVQAVLDASRRNLLSAFSD